VSLDGSGLVVSLSEYLIVCFAVHSGQKETKISNLRQVGGGSRKGEPNKQRGTARDG